MGRITAGASRSQVVGSLEDLGTGIFAVRRLCSPVQGICQKQMCPARAVPTPMDHSAAEPMMVVPWIQAARVLRLQELTSPGVHWCREN